MLFQLWRHCRKGVFYHDKYIDVLENGCISSHSANIWLHKSTDTKLYHFTEADKELLEKFLEDVVGGPSIVFTSRAVVD